VTDTYSGQSARARIFVVDALTQLTASVPHVVLLEDGNSFPVDIVGGSGRFTTEVIDPDDVGVVFEPVDNERRFRVRSGPRAGTATVRISDAVHQHISTDVRVNVLTRGRYVHGLYGQHSDDNTVIDAGDVNGDGASDVLVGVKTSALNGMSSGSAFLYLGGQPQEDDSLGLGPAPAQVFTGPGQNAYMGRGLAAGDYNHDGCSDLAIGVFAHNRIGEVQIWHGCTDGQTLRESFHGRVEDNGFPMGPAPTQLGMRLAGEGRGDNFGYALATGDFNGDGRDDLAVSANAAESPDVRHEDDRLVNNIGRVHIFLNSEQGLGDTPAFSIDGLLVDEDLNLVPTASLAFGFRLAAADANGDGCDDLLVGTTRANHRHGQVTLYTSVADENGCLLSSRPALAIDPDVADALRQSRLGWQVGFGDFNGDCLADLVFSGINTAEVGGPNSNTGAVNVVFGDRSWHPDELQRMSRLDADIVLYGDNGDQFGADFGVGDTNGDGIDDLVIGARLGEHGDTFNDVGEVRIYRGLIDPEGCEGDEGAESYLEEVPIHVVNETFRVSDQFGAALGIAGDVDDDDVNDVVILSPRGPRGAIEDTRDHLGRVFWIPGGLDAPTFADLTSLQMPVVATSESIGSSVEAVGDLNADGFMDLAVGVPRYDRSQPREWGYEVVNQAGAAYVHFGGPAGVRGQPDVMFADHEDHTGNDFFGSTLARAGDFNGDDFDDLAVATPFEELNGPCVQCRVDNVNRNDSGVVHLYYGGPDFGDRFDGPPEDIPRNASPNAVICGPSDMNSGRISHVVYGGFDMNNDGLDDLLMADTSWNGGRGRAFYVPAQPVPEGGVICLTQQDNVLDEGLAARDALGISLGAGDLNGDGCDDMMVGAYNYDPDGRTDAGAVRIHLGWGAQGCPTERIVVTLVGAAAGDNMGYSLVLADVNADGVEDLAIASSGYGPRNRATVLVYDGQEIRNALADVTQDTTIDLADLVQLGLLVDPTDWNNQLFGVSMASVGDVNHDGFEDILVGAQLGAPNRATPTGAAYLYYGSDDAAELMQVDVIVSGQDMASGGFGFRVAGGRLDLRSDSGPTLIVVGAPAAEEPGPLAGEVGAAFMGLIE
jgi:hypothetical protein